MSEVVKRARCPICNGEPNSESYPFRPFCSKRCKLLDLARWLSEDYRVPGEPMGDGGAQREDEEIG
jgi:endogenous inhibitor of DNA gyrase (YacG/DUF329 family)